MLKSFEKKIDGHSVKVVAFAGREGFKIKAKLLRLIGPALGALSASKNSDSKKSKSLSDTAKAIKPAGVSGILNMEISAGMVGDMLSRLLEGVEENETLALVFRLLAFTEVDSKPVWNEQVFDDVFSHNFKFLYSVLFYVLECNYGDFFGAAGIGTDRP